MSLGKPPVEKEETMKSPIIFHLEPPSPVVAEEKAHPEMFEHNEKFSHWKRVRSALLFTPRPKSPQTLSQYFGSDQEEEIPKIQFGEKDITEEIVNVGLMLSDTVRMRNKYMIMNEFKFPWVKPIDILNEPVSKMSYYDGRIRIDGQIRSNEVFQMKEGVFHVYPSSRSVSTGGETPHVQSTPLPVSPSSNRSVLFKPMVSFLEYFKDYNIIGNFVKYAPAKTFCFERLKFLKMKFDLYKEMFAGQEYVDMKEVPHRDFYNVRKVDNHIHLSACMTRKSCLDFIRNKIKKCGQDVVMKDKKTGKLKNLSEVCEELKMDHNSISVDNLNVQADSGTFHRFDRFNEKYNPFGAKLLRNIFFKTSNHMNGRYFAELIREVFNGYQDSKYTMAEPRISIYGRSKNGLKSIAHWVHDHDLYSENVRWVIQIPRLFSMHNKINNVKNFEQYLFEIFQPFFEATVNPQKDIIVSNFLQNYLVGFDSVDDESKVETELSARTPSPDKWGTTKATKNQNPPYSYYNYYFWANINVLNQLRASKGMSTFGFRPHCGEAGDIKHLASSFLCADSINHGIELRHSPVLQYLYYLAQIGISVSPLSNNYLFLDYKENPFPEFFAQGFNITLSTDDPLMFHNTVEPLMEEYSISQQIMNFSTADICEIARNSVLQSGWSDEHKQNWISRYFDHHGAISNNIRKTNVPQIRMQYRHETLLEEHLFLQKVFQRSEDFGKGLNLTQQRAFLSRDALVRLIHDLHQHRIELFSTVPKKSEHKEKRKEPNPFSPTPATPQQREVKYVYVMKKDRKMSEDEQSEIDDLKKQLLEAKQMIERLRMSRLDIDRQAKDWKTRKREIKRKKKELKKKFKKQYVKKNMKKVEEESEGTE